MAKDKIKETGNLIWKWILFIMLPPLTLIITWEFAKVLYQFGLLWSLLMVIIGILFEILEVIALFNETKKIFNL
jgi:hypothetical protein